MKRDDNPDKNGVAGGRYDAEAYTDIFREHDMRLSSEIASIMILHDDCISVAVSNLSF